MSSRSPVSCRIAKITACPGVSLLDGVEGGGGEEHREMVLKGIKSYRNGQNSVLFLTQSSGFYSEQEATSEPQGRKKKEKLKQQKGLKMLIFLPYVNGVSHLPYLLRTHKDTQGRAQRHPWQRWAEQALCISHAGVSCRHPSLPLTSSMHPWGAVGFGLTAFFTPINRKEMQNIFLVKSFASPMVGRVLLGFCD